MKRTISLIICSILIFAFSISSLGFVIIAVKSIKLNSSAVNLNVGKTFILKGTITPANATNKKLTFVSADKSIASVDAKGVVKGIKLGKTVITVTSAANKKAVAKCNVTISEVTSKFPLVNKKIKVKIFANPVTWVQDLSTNYTALKLEEKTNVHVEWIIGGQEINQKINLILASQNGLPDAFLGCGLSNERLLTFGSQGLIIPLNKYIDSSGVGTKNMFKFDTGIRGQITSSDGNIYGLPNYNEALHANFQQKSWINKKWLDNLGLKIPTTTDEFYNVLKAFKEKDANGNGNPNDEIPMAANESDWSTTLDGFLMNPFVLNQGKSTDRLLWDNGKWAPAYIKPEWKEGLKYLRKLYKEGLIFEECFITNRAQIKMLSGNPAGNRLGAMNAVVPTQFVDIATKTRDEYVVLPPLKGPSGLKQTPWFPYGLQSGSFVITNKCKYPEILFRWADYFYEDPYFFFGEKDVDWREAKEGEVGMDDKPAKYKVNIVSGNPQNKVMGISHVLWTQEFRNAAVVTPGEFNQEKIVYDATKALYQPFQPKKLFYTQNFKSSVNNEVSELKANIRGYVDESIARFVTGDLNIDSDWNRYISDLDSMGLKRMIQIINEEYIRQYGN